MSWEALNSGKVHERASHHPGPANHALRGSMLAYHYLRALQLALNQTQAETIEEAAASAAGPGSESRSGLNLGPRSGPAGIEMQRAAFEDQVIDIQRPLPDPLLCSPRICAGPVSCATTFLPRAGDGLAPFLPIVVGYSTLSGHAGSIVT